MVDCPSRHVTGPIDPAVADALTAIPLRTPPVNLHHYADALAARRGRPIRLVGQHHAGTRPSAVVVSTATDDTIVYDTATTPLHARHNVAHELAHLALGHDTANDRSAGTDLPADLLRRVAPDLSPDLIRRILGRSVHREQHEHQAETLATLMMIDTATTPTGPADPTDPLTPTTPRRALRTPQRYSPSAVQRLQSALDPLWHLLPTAAAADLTLTLPGSPTLTLYRRVVELRDALLLLRPYTHPDIRAWIHQHARRALASTASTARLTSAAELLTAIHAYQAAQHPNPTPAAAPAITPPPDLHHDAHTLLDLLHDLHHPLVTALAHRARSHTDDGTLP